MEKAGMKRIELTQKILQEWFDYIDGKLYWKKSPAKHIKEGFEAGCLNRYGYKRIRFCGKEYMAHRLIWIWHGFELIDGLQIDHINRNKIDNRIENLRQVDCSTNKLNNNAKYISFDKKTNKWRAYIPAIKRKQKELGRFLTKAEAESAVCYYFKNLI